MNCQSDAKFRCSILVRRPPYNLRDRSSHYELARGPWEGFVEESEGHDASKRTKRRESTLP
jgi:hypothetical protein